MTPAAPISERGVVLAACVTTGTALSLSAVSGYILDPMAADFGLDSSNTVMLKYIPSLFAIGMVFLAGVLGDRVGRRRVIILGAAGFTLGALATGLAPHLSVAVAGQSLMRASESLLSVVALALLSATVLDPQRRASAFGTLGVVKPLVYLTLPIVAGFLVTWLDWRSVTGLWVIMGGVGLIVAVRFVPRGSGDQGAGELATPLLAGVALVLIVQVINSAGSDGLFSAPTLLRLAASAVVVVALLAAHRRLRRPTLSFAPLRNRQAVLLFATLALIPVAALYYATYLVFQYAFGLTPLQISLIMIPAQVVGIIGAKLAGRILNTVGLTRAGVGGFASFAVVQALFLLVGPGGVALTATLMGLFNFIAVFVGVVLSKAIMDTAAPSEDGTTSSYRAASARIGDALAPLAMTALVVGTYQGSLESRAVDAGLDASIVAADAGDLVDAQRAGDEAPPPPAQDAVPVDALHEAAMLDALHAKALAGVAVAAVGGMLFFIATRRRRDDDRATTAV